MTVSAGPDRSGRVLAAVTGEGTGQSGITTVTDRTGASITFTVTDRPVVVRFHEPWIGSVTNPSTIVVSMTDAAGAAIPALIGGNWNVVAPASATFTCVAEGVITTPGTYTVKVRVARSAGTGTVSVGLGAVGTPWYYRFSATET